MTQLTDPDALASAMIDWMGDNRALLDRLMSEEGSRAIHEEFLLAEGGTLPDRATRIERARVASARAWLRLLARALEESWADAPEGLAAQVERRAASATERREALELEESAIEERRGLSRDPEDDARRVMLRAQGRLFAEIVGEIALDGDGSGPDLGRRVGARLRGDDARLRQVEAEALAAWGARQVEADPETRSMSAAPPEADPTRIAEAAAVWAHVRILTEAMAAELTAQPAASAED